MTLPPSIPSMSLIESSRLNAVLLLLTEAQYRPMNGVQMRALVRQALDALSPQLSILSAQEAFERVRETGHDYADR